MGKKEKRVLPPNASLEPSKQKEFNQKVQSAKETGKDGPIQPGVVYLSHLPWGFEEEPIKKFLSQFGTITKLRVSRSKKTGNSRGYAYVEFAYDEVARIVAETMNNYIMFGKLVKCKHLGTVHPRTFKGANRPFRKPMHQENAIRRRNAVKSPDALMASRKRAVTKYRKKKTKLADLGIEYELDNLEQPIPALDVKQGETDGKNSEKVKSRPQKRKRAESVSAETDSATTGHAKKKGRKSESVPEKVSPSKKGRHLSATAKVTEDFASNVVKELLNVKPAGDKKPKVTKSLKGLHKSGERETRKRKRAENR